MTLDEIGHGVTLSPRLRGAFFFAMSQEEDASLTLTVGEASRRRRSNETPHELIRVADWEIPFQRSVQWQSNSVNCEVNVDTASSDSHHWSEDV